MVVESGNGLLNLGVSCYVLESIVVSGSKSSSLVVGQIWQFIIELNLGLVVESWSCFSCLGVGCRVWELVV